MAKFFKGAKFDKYEDLSGQYYENTVVEGNTISEVEASKVFLAQLAEEGIDEATIKKVDKVYDSCYNAATIGLGEKAREILNKHKDVDRVTGVVNFGNNRSTTLTWSRSSENVNPKNPEEKIVKHFSLRAKDETKHYGWNSIRKEMSDKFSEGL